jgi:hypothetical protein
LFSQKPDYCKERIAFWYLFQLFLSCKVSEMTLILKVSQLS